MQIPLLHARRSEPPHDNADTPRHLCGGSQRGQWPTAVPAIGTVIVVQFRKSKRFGIARFTVSNRGIGSSVGGGPFRLSFGADGKTRRTIRVPGAGVWDTKVIGGRRRQRRRPFRTLLIIVGVVAAIIVACNATNTQDRAAAPPKAPPAPMGQQVRDGHMAFVVRSVERAPAIERTTGFGNDAYRAEGEYIVVHMTITNTDAPDPRYNPMTDAPPSVKYQAQDQTMEVGTKRFDPDTSAAQAVDSSIVLVDPNQSAEVVLPFDVPVGTELGVLEVHDSAFSNGARLALQ